MSHPPFLEPWLCLQMFEEISRQMEQVCLNRGGTWKMTRWDEGGGLWVVWWETKPQAGWFAFDARYIPHDGDTPYARQMEIAQFIDIRVKAMLAGVDSREAGIRDNHRPWQLDRWWWRDKQTTEAPNV